jgi:hypothetical protein
VQKPSRVFNILVPPILTKQPIKDRLRDLKPVICIPAPDNRHKIIFGLYIGGRWVTAEDILGLPRDREIKIVGQLSLKSKRAFVTAYVDDFREKIELPVIRHFLSDLRVPALARENDISTYVHMFQWENVAIPYVTDVQLGREHLFESEEARKHKKWVMINTAPKKPPSGATRC